MQSNTHESEIKPIRAAQYIRMSTEHQQYSTANQDDVIQEYAKRRNFVIVRTFADAGKSGLNVAGRHSLQSLIAAVQDGSADFDAVLVYDVSRWGRFQDADESAYYEYLCKRAGITVHYCAEQFENDGGPTSTIIKSVKRAMAGEYSRELSTKVFQGQCRLIELGYRQGGAAGFGLRRMLMDQTGKTKGELSRGESKSLQTDRVILVRGPADEVETVRRVYRMFAADGLREQQIADQLNAEGLATDLGRKWTRGTVRQLLTNEKYIGNNVFNRTSFKLKQRRTRNDPSRWIRKESAFEAIVTPELFYTTQGIIRERSKCYTNEEMITRLRELMENNTTLSAGLIDASENIPTSATYRTRFGSLIRAYQLAGFTPAHDYHYLQINQKLRDLYPKMIGDVIAKLGSAGATITEDAATNLFLINGEYSAEMVLSRCRKTTSGSLRWMVNLQRRVAPDITILVRMDATNDQVSDYYLLPIMDIQDPRLLLCESNGVCLDTYQFDSLDYFMSLSQRCKIEVAA
jgi:DNA invertase Pin-like site-specific DNA recombinase